METEYIKGEPRVNHDKLNIMTVDVKYAIVEELLYYQSGPFSGVAWSDFNGVQSEDSVFLGQLHGVCITADKDGNVLSEGEWKYNDAVGVHKQFYPSGVLKKLEVYAGDDDPCESKEFNSSGVLVREVQQHPYTFCIRHWNQDGIKYHEYDRTNSYLFNTNQHVVLTERLDRTINVDEEELYKCAFDLVGYGDYQVDAIFTWLRIELDKGQHASDLQIDLLTHENPKVVQRALGLGVSTRTMPAYIKLMLENRRELTSLGRKESSGHITLSEYACSRLNNFMTESKEEEFTSEKALIAEFENRMRKLAERRKHHNYRIKEIKGKWPVATAIYKKTHRVYDLCKSSSTPAPSKKKINYARSYDFEVDGLIYRKSLTFRDREPPMTVRVRYRRKKPIDNYEVRQTEYVNCGTHSF